jgi:hypothetical protein
MTSADAACVVSATLVAITVTVCDELSDTGAEYTPLLVMLPSPGFNDHVTPEFFVPDTVAANCACFPGPTCMLFGVTEIVTLGFKVTAAVAVWVESALLVALIVTVCRLGMFEGAV